MVLILLHTKKRVSLWVEAGPTYGPDYTVVRPTEAGEIRFARDWRAAFACYENLIGEALPGGMEPKRA